MWGATIWNGEWNGGLKSEMKIGIENKAMCGLWSRVPLLGFTDKISTVQMF